MMLSCRKRGSRALVVAGTIVLVLVATSAAAQIPGPKGRASFTATVGGCLPALDDVNGDIARGNEALRSYGWSAMDEINLGYTFTGDLRARVYGPLSLSLGGGETAAQTDIDFDQVISVKPQMSFYHVRLFYDLPFKPMPKLYLRVGAGPVQSTSAKVSVRHERRATEGGTQWVESATFKAKGLGAARASRRRVPAQPANHPGPRRRLSPARPRSGRRRRQLPRLEPQRAEPQRSARGSGWRRHHHPVDPNRCREQGGSCRSRSLRSR